MSQRDLSREKRQKVHIFDDDSTDSHPSTPRPAAGLTAISGPAIDVPALGDSRRSDPLSDSRLRAGSSRIPGAQLKQQTYHRVVVDGDDGEKEFVKCADMIARCINARNRYKHMDEGEAEDNEAFDENENVISFIQAVCSEQSAGDSSAFPMVDGVYTFRGMQTAAVDWKTYMSDIKLIFAAIENGPCLSSARSRLTTLEEKFALYSLMNTELEEESDRFRRGGGVYAKNTRVDNNVSLATLATAPQLVEFLVSSVKTQPNVRFSVDSSENYMTLAETVQALHISDPATLTVDGLGLHPPLYRNRFQPFDVFHDTLNPAGKVSSHLLNSFVSVNGPNQGELFAQLVRPMLERAEFVDGQVVAFDMKVPICGRDEDEWHHMASWIHEQGFNQFSRVMWSVMIPRREYERSSYNCTTHADQLRHIFLPMLLATVSPHDPKYTDISAMLSKVGQIVVVPDTAGRQKNFLPEKVSPAQIPWGEQVDDYYFFYYVWSNLCTLNALRRRLGMNTIQLRIACVENFPAFDQLVCSYLLADSVEHALSLSRSWILQYLFLMSRVGIIMSPLCDNALRVSYFQHPFVSFFKRGLHVSLATSDPLHFHHSATPLTEEYATMMKISALTPMDLCEIARNSVLISNFSMEAKREWLGRQFQPIGSFGNDMSLSSVCDFRLQFRHECLLHEQSILNMMLAQTVKPGGPPAAVMTFFPAVNSSTQLTPEDLRAMRKMNYTDRRIVYPRVEVFNARSTSQKLNYMAAAESIRRVVSLRKKYSHTQVVDVNVEDVFSSKFDESIWEYNNFYGVFLVSRIGKPPPWPVFIPPVEEFINDVKFIRQVVVGDPAVIQLASHRLDLLEHRFLLHLSMNISKESGTLEEKEFNNRDFFTARKVDNNIQTDSGMNARTLLDFFVEKAQNNGDDVVFDEANVPVTLRQLLERLHVDPSRITVDELNHLMKADAQFRDIFLSTDNFMQGRYFAELTKRTLDLYQLDEYTFSENRLIIHGRSSREWWNLAHWFDRYGMASSQNRWMVSLPRNYRKLRQSGHVKNFGEFLDNIFQPLWHISLHPAYDTKFHSFLTHVSGFDCIDDESKVDLPLAGTFPHDWSSDLNPPYNFYLYYYWANIVSLNEFRASRGLCRFTFRPQCGELGLVDHLIGAFLVANSINHGVTLHTHPAVEYLYYLTQIGIAMSPLSNTKEASPYLTNPFPLFFHRGLNVSLSTNQPLYFHFTREPLIEEYSIAAKIWKMEFNDLSEIARNSVLQSGFYPAWKERALGKLYDLQSTLGNDVTKSRLSDIRVAYRFETYHTEMNFLDSLLTDGQRMTRAMRLLEEEIAIYESVMKVKVIMPTAPGAESTDDEYGDDIKSTLRRLRAEVDELNRDVGRNRMMEQQLTTINATMATKIQSIRSRLKTLPLSILGGLTLQGLEHHTTEKSEAQPADEPDHSASAAQSSRSSDGGETPAK